MNIAFFGSSLLSSYWNGAATYYRGLLRALADLGHDITFYEPDAYDRQAHRDIEPPTWAEVIVYGNSRGAVMEQLRHASRADVVVKASGVGVFDELLEAEVASLRAPHRTVIFWDVDAPATLQRMASTPDDPLRIHVPRYDAILTYGGGPKVIARYHDFGAKVCLPIYNALDPESHFPTAPLDELSADLSFLGNRLPDREARVEDFFFTASRLSPKFRFLLGGSGWEDKARPANVKYLGHVSTRDHNAFNCSARAVLNINRADMAQYGYSPPTRIFEAAGAGACLITDQWEGIDEFFEPGTEILTVRDGRELADTLEALPLEKARAIGEAALRKARAKHTYEQRARQVSVFLKGGLV